MLARPLLILIGLLSCTGCAGTLLHLAADAKVTPEMPSAGNAGPLVPMSVPDSMPLERDAPLVVVLDVDGLLLNTDFTGLNSAGENPVSLFRERLDAIATNPCVRAVVVRINSPGGGVTATDIMWHDLMRFKRCTRLPVVACLMDVGTGEDYLATAADQIVAHPTSVTGGIGVILNLYNLQDALQQFNIAGVPIKSGDKIDLGSPIKALDDTKRKLLQKMADDFHDRFHEVVEQSRPEVDTNDKSNFDGRVFTAHEAQNRRLIDSIGYLDDAICMARHMGHVPSAQVVLYHRQNDQARTPYSLTPNIPLGSGLIPVSLPGLDRSKLPSFLYLWQPEPTMERLSGR